MEQGFPRRSGGGGGVSVDFSYILLWVFFNSKTSYGTVRLYMAHGCISSAQVVTCEKAGSSWRKKENAILIYISVNLEWLLKKYMDIKNPKTPACLEEH